MFLKMLGGFIGEILIITFSGNVYTFFENFFVWIEEKCCQMKKCCIYSKELKNISGKIL